jgi:peptidoglycan/xylan/chitin deacetylase (PgdA/CDA1 family)
VNPQAAVDLQPAVVDLQPAVVDLQTAAPNSRPAIATTSSGTVEVFYREPAGSVATRVWNDSGWSAATGLGGRVVGAPAVAYAQGRLYLYARGTDDALWTRVRTGTSWSGWTSLGGVLTAGPAATGWSDGRVDVVVRGTSDGAWWKTYTSAGWSGWRGLGGSAVSEPAVVATGTGALGLFVTGADNAVWTKSLGVGGWSGWSSLGGQTWNAPAVARAPDTGELVLTVRGTSRSLTVRRAPAGGSWSGWQSLGGVLIDGPAVAATAGGATWVVGRGADQAFWTRRLTSGTWSAWARAWAVPSGPPALPADRAGRDWEAVPTSSKVVALTFDAGGNAAGLSSILSTLEVKRVPATFFLTGDWARTDFPAQANRIVVGGFVVGNHTMTHPHLPQLTDAQAIAEVTGAAAAIVGTVGVDPHPLFRFPYGERTQSTISLLNGLGYVPVRWTVDTLGWEGASAGITPAVIAQRVADNLQPGEIVLMHVGSANDGTTLDAAALPTVIDQLRARGYSFATLTALTG